MKIIKKHHPNIEEKLATQIADYIQKIRNLKLDKTPGIAETIDWASGIAALGNDEQATYKSLSCLLKSKDDIELVKEELFK